MASTNDQLRLGNAPLTTNKLNSTGDEPTNVVPISPPIITCPEMFTEPTIQDTRPITPPLAETVQPVIEVDDNPDRNPEVPEPPSPPPYRTRSRGRVSDHTWVRDSRI